MADNADGYRGRLIVDALQVYEITPEPGFSLLATMNPGGDHGKREVRRTDRCLQISGCFCMPLLTLSVTT